MIEKQITLTYTGFERDQLHKLGEWLLTACKQMPATSLQEVLALYLESSYLNLHTLVQLLNKDCEKLSVTVEQAKQLRAILAALLLINKLGYDSEPGRNATVLLRDLASITTGQKSAVDKSKSCG